ncbi:MAG: YceI family protein [Aliidiomarina sp.]|uniref:YceI family protein n=1 Tax=Aliidiomarina sp. TaxID=1872439 RepID=UPI0025B7C40B|nr:YceI family protein [Aliidiomarina sp.]MCH8502134.1 YceI family protein [Aliidiomarina sp.]
MSTFKSIALASFLAGSTLLVTTANAADYVIDTEGAHASINFKIDHLGVSYVVGRFNEFTGTFTFDSENPDNNRIEVTVKTASVDSNHTERDNHVRSSDYLDVERWSEARFVSTRYVDLGEGKGQVIGNLTLFGETREVTIDVAKYGEGADPWGGYRAGFTGELAINVGDFGMDFNLGPAAQTVYLDLHVEGIRQ